MAGLNKRNKRNKVAIKKTTGINSALKKLLVVLISVLVFFSILLGIKKYFTITDVTVSGNKHYSDEEIMDMIATGPLAKNSIFLFIKYNNKSIKNIPFIEQMDVEILSPSSIKVNVYEKAIAGYVEYLGHYMYFDKDGIVVEGSLEETEDVPFVTGLSFDHMVLNERLPVEDEDIFMLILSITQLLNKYNISTDKIFFDIDQNITLYFGSSRVYLGSSDYIDEKINEMHLLLPKLEGFSGTLHMENYTGDASVFSFEKDDVLTENQDGSEAEEGENNDESTSDTDSE